jgi:acyl-CoA synthetase (AMP-forming)/AMP-acid ligase II
MLAAAVAGKSLTVLNEDYTQQQVKALVTELQIDLLVLREPLTGELPCLQLRPLELQGLDSKSLSPTDDSFFEEIDAELLILTSGTTEKPKCVRYRWSDLIGQVGHQRSLDDDRWLLAYKLNHFAGVQLVAHVLNNSSTLVLAASTQVVDAIAAMASLGVTHISSTPTFWRFALAQFEDSKALPRLRHVTLGSEPVSADLLQRLAALFPTARISHIYALTEAGSCISVSDGRPGLPISVLERPTDAPVQFRIVKGELQVKTRHGMRGYTMQADEMSWGRNGWFITGDLVRVQGDRILFVGRKSETINVGGVKVHPLEVESVIATLPGVKLVLAYGQQNPIVGQIVAVDLMLKDGWSADVVEASVRSACESLPKHSRPRRINVVDSLLTNNFKLDRRGVKTQ